MAIDLNNGYVDLLRLWREKNGKTLTLVAYGDPAEPDNIAIEDPESHSVVIDFDRPVGKEQMTEAPPSEYAKLQAVMNAAECGEEDAADFLRELDDRGYGLIPLSESEPLSEEIQDATTAALMEIKSVPTTLFLTKLHLQNFEVGEV